MSGTITCETAEACRLLTHGQEQIVVSMAHVGLVATVIAIVLTVMYFEVTRDE